MFRASIKLATIALMMQITLSMASAQVPGTPVGTPEATGPSLIFEPQDTDNRNYFDIEMKAGESRTLSITIGNGGAEPVDLVTYAADGYTVRNGGFDLRDIASPDTGPTTWLNYPDEEFTLKPSEANERRFSISVPDGTEAGEYITGIALQSVDPVNGDEQEGMFQFRQFVRSVRAVRVTVPGPVKPSLELGDVSVDQEGNTPAIIIGIANTGNVLLTPKGEVEVRDTNGQILLSAPVQMGPVYAGHQTTVWIGLAAPIPEGNYEVTASLSDEDQDVTATLDNAPLAVAAPTTPAPPPPITIASTSVQAGPDADNVQFAVVDATISNTGEPIGNAQLSLLVSKDGEEVERFPISQALSLQTGDTAINTRYIPLEGWSSGEWTFELLLETVESSGAAVVVASQPIEGSITIP